MIRYLKSMLRASPDTLALDGMDVSEIQLDIEATWHLRMEDLGLGGEATVHDMAEQIAARAQLLSADVLPRLIAILADRLSRDAATIREQTRLS